MYVLQEILETPLKISGLDLTLFSKILREKLKEVRENAKVASTASLKSRKPRICDVVGIAGQRAVATLLKACSLFHQAVSSIL